MRAVERVGAVARRLTRSHCVGPRATARRIGSVAAGVLIVGAGMQLVPVAADASTATTSVLDAATNAAWNGETVGASAYDTMNLTGDGTAIPTGTVTYSFFHNGTCSAQAASSNPQTVSPTGTVPASAATGPLGAGSYSFQASYPGDASNAPVTSSCEPFTVAAITNATLNVVVDANGVGWTGSEPLGSVATGAASFSGSSTAIPPSGSVTYSFFNNGACTAPAVAPTGSVTVGAGGTVPASGATAALGGGTYSLRASYPGDSNYGAMTSGCQSYSVAASNGVSVPTIVSDAATNQSWTGLEVTGANAYDTASITGVSGFTPVGTVTYSLFANGTCQGAPTSQSPEPVTLGAVPNGPVSPSLGAGSYSYQASYSGDTNYQPTTGLCEPFQVQKRTPTIATTVNDAGTHAPWSASEVTGASAYDTGTVLGATAAGLTPGGTATYSFFGTGLCQGNPSVLPAVGVTAGALGPSQTVGPLNRGSYSFQVSYGGDGNYLPTLSTCEPFNVGVATPSSPRIANVPSTATEFGTFVASVSTNGDGPTSVISSTPSVCTVGSDGRTVSFVLYGTCSLTALVNTGSNFGAAAGSPQLLVVIAAPRGYWLVGSDGGIFSFGVAQFHGSMGGIPLQRPVVGITPTSGKNGYWLVASDGGVFSFGDSTYYGSLPGLGLHPAGSGVAHSLNAPVVGIVPSSSQHGYFMVASDGGVFAFGDAQFEGSCPGIGGCVGSAVAVLPDHSGHGYWLVTNTGAVYAFGDAGYYGASAPFGVAAVDAIATSDGHGYWILYANGAVISFGDASSLGSPVGYVNVYNPATSIFPTADGHGYWVASTRGDVFSYGNAPFLGGMAATNLNGAIIAAYGF